MSKYDGSRKQEGYGDNCNGLTLPHIQVANSIWVADQLAVQPSYEALLGSNDLIYETDFASDDFGSTVNACVEEATLGLIDSIIPSGRMDWAYLIAVNAIYFKASWEKSFSERDTTTDFFYSVHASNKVEVSEVRYM